jgi:3-oxoacyl-[acyl-carrier protein] reductase
MALVVDLKPHLALVTGATGGIGQATSLALGNLGCSIAVHYNTAVDTASSLVSELKSLGVRAAAFQADLSSYDETRRLHAEVVRELGHPSILFNNAGVTQGKSGVKDISEITIEDFEATWRANCGTGFLLTQLCLPAMVGNGWGRVIFCSSVAGFTGGVVGPHYAYVLVVRLADSKMIDSPLNAVDHRSRLFMALYTGWRMRMVKKASPSTESRPL